MMIENAKESFADGKGRVAVVTGATGFIGGHLCEELLRRGWRVRALTRRASGYLPDGISRVLVPDLGDEALVADALSSASAMIHLAGRAHVLHDSAADPEAAFHAGNVAPTLACARAAMRAGLESFVFMSSVGAIAGNDDGTVSEATPPRPVNAYGRSKLAAERALAEATRSSRMRVVSVRPPMIYGPGMRGNPWRLFRLVATGVPLPFASVHNARTIAFVGNVVAHMADLLCLRSPTRASTYLVGDDAPVSTPQLVREIANALHVRARLFPVPMLALHATARAGDVIGRALPVGFNSDALRAMTGDLVLDTSAFRRDVGTPQRFSRELSLGLTARWFQIAQSPSDRAT